jgi:hypothetical protein
MRDVRAILIDPFTCAVTEVEHDASDYRNIYSLISHEVHPVHCFTCAYSSWLRPGEAIFVDDNGLLNRPVRFFKFADYAQPLAGKGLILGSSKSGKTIGATSKLLTITSAVVFGERVPGVGVVQTNTPWQKENAARAGQAVRP